MANGYMPRSDNAAAQWMRAFAGGLMQSPEVYHLSAGEADEVNDAVSAFLSALQVASEPATRTAGAVCSKSAARAVAERVCAVFYPRIKADPTITDQQKIDIGVRPISRGRSRIDAPDSSPFLKLLALSTGGHTIGFEDTSAPGRLAKPFGATQLALFRRFQDSADETPQLVGCFTRSPIRVNYDVADNGRTAIYQARWMTRRGEFGPWGLPMNAPVVALAPLFGMPQAA